VIHLELLIPTLVQSGAEKQLVLLATGLPRAEFDVHVTCLTSGGPYVDTLHAAEIPVTLLGKKFQFDPLAFFRLRKHLRQRQPDILHTWLFAANSYGRLALPRGTPTRVIVSERCVDSWKSWQLQVDRRLVSRTDCLVGNSQAVVDFYRPLGYPDSKLRVIPNGVEAPPAPRQTRSEFLKELQLPEDAKLAMFVGRLAPQKRVSDLLWSIQLLRQVDPRAYLVVVGDGPLRASLEQYAREVEAISHVRFVGHRSDAASLLHHADVVWLASEFEGMSNSLMEAMACGRPIVATAIPPNQELIQHGTHGYLVNIGDTAGFAQFTLKLLNDSDLSARLGTIAQERVATELSVPRMIQRYAELYRVMSEPRGRDQCSIDAPTAR
jgi:glycosyltransferase involved in cell wall biosynthesis